MPLPQMSEYQAALQYPKHSFTDLALKCCQCEQNAFGFPQVATGNFALTYCLFDPTRQWAVRCFHKQTGELESRYAAISSHLDKINSDFFVKFEYQKSGILIQGNNYPIVKMDWVKGDLISQYIEKNLNSKAQLKALCDELLRCANMLEANKIRHGDLQHGNIMLSNGHIKLIDYDGMIVPSLKITRNTEVGHANYQHPQRDESCLGYEIDRFSFIVIYLSIFALIKKPQLWKEYNSGDNLLLVRKDFLYPRKSKLITELLNICSMRQCIINFISLCESDISNVPSLDAFIKKINATLVVSVAMKPTSRMRLHQNTIIAADDTLALLNNVGNVIEVVGRVTNITTGTTKFGAPFWYVFVGENQENCFKIVMWSSIMEKIKTQGIDINFYNGRWISIIGLISTYKSKPQIELTFGSKINVFLNKQEAEERIAESEPTTQPCQVPQPVCLTAILDGMGCDYIDNRSKGGALWLLGGQERRSFVNQLAKLGIEFTYKKDGGKSTQYKKAWYTTYGY